MKFNQIIKSIIVEQGRYEILKKTYTQPKKKGDKVKPAKMSLEQLNKMVMTDPTTRRAVSYTHLRAHEDATLSRMPSSA